MFLIIVLIIFGVCLVGTKFLDRLLGVLAGAVLGVIILIVVLCIIVWGFLKMYLSVNRLSTNIM